MSDRARLLDEGLQALIDAWTGEPFTFRGERVQVTPRPLQQPHPPITVGGYSRAAARRAARFGVDFMPMTHSDAFEHYRAALAELGKPVPPPNPGAPYMFLQVVEDPERAWEVAKPHVLYQRRFLGQSYGRAMDLPGDDRLTVSDPEVIRQGPHLIGNPEQVVDRIRRYRAMGWFDHLALWMQLPGMDPRETARSIELFAKAVMPHFR